MQLMPRLSKEFGVNDPGSIRGRTFVLAGAEYLKQLLDRFDGNVELALRQLQRRLPNCRQGERYAAIPTLFWQNPQGIRQDHQGVTGL